MDGWIDGWMDTWGKYIRRRDGMTDGYQTACNSTFFSKCAKKKSNHIAFKTFIAFSCSCTIVDLKIDKNL